MRVLLSTYGGRGDVEPLVGLAVRLCELGAEVQMCVPVDRAERPTEVGVAVVLAGPPVRPLVQGVARPSPADLPRLASEVMAAQFDTLGAAAEGFDALLATGLLPAAASARSVAEKLGIRYVYAAYCPIFLSSPHHAPTPFPGRPFPPDVTDNRVLWDLQAQIANDLFGAALNTRRASTGLPVVDNVYEYGFTNHPWLAADPTLGPWQEPADLEVVQTGAWILPDERPLPAELEAFLDAGTPPVYVGFGSMRAPTDIARAAIEAIRAQGRRALVPLGWVGPALIDDGRPGRGAAGRDTPDGGPGHRRGTRRPSSDHRVLVSRAHNGPGRRDARPSNRRGQHDPYRRSDGGGAAAARSDEPRRTTSFRVNHARSSSRRVCPRQQARPWTATMPL